MGERLKDKVAIVTGGGAGFGEGIVKRFVEEGAHVVIADIDVTVAEKVAADVGNGAIAIAADVSKRADVEAMVNTAVETFGGLDILVNNAGTTNRNAPMGETDEAMFDHIYAVNMKSVFHGTQVAVPHMKARGGGSIVNTASTAGLRPRPGLAWYNASKGWDITATKSLAVELAPDNIRVNCICPVAGETQLLPLFMGEDTPERRAQFASVIPLGRFSKPLDIANAVLFLCSDEAEFLTGVAMEVDGGRCI